MTKRRSKSAMVAGMGVSRAILLATVSAVVVLSASPASAFSLGSLLGGGGGATGDGCRGEDSDEGAMVGGVVGAAVGYYFGGYQGAAMGYAMGSEAGGQAGSVTSGMTGGYTGCPVVESEPGAFEIQEVKQTVQMFIQSYEAIQQTAHQAKMITRSEYSLVNWLLDNWRSFLSLFSGDSQAITWNEPEVRDGFETAYPEAPVFETHDDFVALQDRQAEIGRSASIDSKRVSAALAMDIEALSGKLEELEDARKECEGQTCVADINAQIGMVTAQLQAKTALMQAAHNRVSESQLDAEREAKRAADAEFERSMRGFDTYSGAGY